MRSAARPRLTSAAALRSDGDTYDCNLYFYVNDNPLLYLDPSGMRVWTPTPFVETATGQVVAEVTEAAEAEAAAGAVARIMAAELGWNRAREEAEVASFTHEQQSRRVVA